MSKKTINVAVSGLNAIDSPGPGMAVVRGLREAKSFDVRIIGLAYDTLEPMIYMHDLIDKTYQMPYPSGGTDIMLERLAYIHSVEKIDVIIPNFDAELYSFIKLEDALKQMGIQMFLPTFDQFEERHKVNLSDFGKRYNILVPYSKGINDISEIYHLDSELDYPLLVKGKWYDAHIAYSQEQVRTYFNRISAKWGLPIVLQEFVHGTEYNVTGLGDGNGNTISAVPMRKQYITDKGKAWAGISIDEPKLIELTKHFIASTKWRGGFELELIKSQDNKYYLLEINPRIPAWAYLAVAVGQNIPETLVRMALGEQVKPFEHYDVGKFFVRYSSEIIVDRSEFENLSINGEL